MKKKLEEAIEALAKKAESSDKGIEAQQFAQAACNLSNVTLSNVIVGLNLK